MKEPITVGNTTMFAKTIPVNILFDQIYDTMEGSPDEVVGERFQALEIDGAYLVVVETIFSEKPSKQEYKAFLTREDAFEYLKMFGVEIDDPEVDSERDYHADE